MTCNDICHRYEITKPKGVGRYASGQKRCNSCNIFVEWDGMFCPCCKLQLRRSPRSRKYREKLVEIKRI